MVTFEVDEVAPAEQRLATRPMRDRLRDALAVGGDPATPLIDHGGTHPLLGAVAIAFAQHRPLVLSPDAVWLTIAQGVAQHVRLNAAALRPRLVRHQGRARIVAGMSAWPADAASWADVVGQLCAGLADHVGDGRARLLTCDFSTTTDVDRVASQVVVMDTYAPYFSYWLVCICGIPAITLTGTVADWQRIRARIDVLAELDLERWCRSLVPIADHLVRAASGDIDVAFWRRIYNPQDAYGGSLVTGWITRLYPYLVEAGTVACPNPMLDLPIDDPRGHDRRGDYRGPGIRTDQVSHTSSRVLVHLDAPPTAGRGAVALHGGVVGVTQHEDGALQPILGWYLLPAKLELADVLDRMVGTEGCVAAPSTSSRTERRGLQGPADVIALFDRVASASLFGGAWRLREPRACQLTAKMLDHRTSIAGISMGCIFDLSDGQALCYACVGDFKLGWFRARVTPTPGDWVVETNLADAPEDIAMLGDSLALILETALDTGGDVSALAHGTLADFVRKR